jgi:hypothetical protein
MTIAHTAPKLAAIAIALLTTLSARGAMADPPVGPPKQDVVPARDVVAYTVLGFGAAALVVGIAETAQYFSLANGAQSDLRTFTGSSACAEQLNAAALDACQKSKDAATASLIAGIAYGSAAALATTGIILLLTRPKATPEAGHVDLTPSVSARSAGVQLRVSF